jgi:hypothetical protein
VVFGLKRPSMSVQNLFFARPALKKPSPPLFSTTGCRKRHKDVLPAQFFAYFTPSAAVLGKIEGCKKTHIWLMNMPKNYLKQVSL